jgi:hypothetical protein
VSVTGLTLSAGTHLMRVVMDTNATGQVGNMNYFNFSLMPTATPSASPTLTGSPSPTATPTASPSASPSVTATWSSSATFSVSPSVTPSPTRSPSLSPSPSLSASPSASPSPTTSLSPSASPSPGPSATAGPAPAATPPPGNPDVEKVLMVPNPSYGDRVQVCYQLQGSVDQVEIRVYAKSTALVQSASDVSKGPGWNSTWLDISGLSSGLYFVRVAAISGSQKGKVAMGKWVLLH